MDDGSPSSFFSRKTHSFEIHLKRLFVCSQEFPLTDVLVLVVADVHLKTRKSSQEMVNIPRTSYSLPFSGCLLLLFSKHHYCMPHARKNTARALGGKRPGKEIIIYPLHAETSSLFLLVYLSVKTFNLSSISLSQQQQLQQQEQLERCMCKRFCT